MHKNSTFDTKKKIHKFDSIQQLLFPLSQKDKVKMMEDAAAVRQEKLVISAELDQIKKGKGDQIKGLQADVDRLLDDISKGQELRKVDCQIEHDYERQEKRFLVKGKVIKIDPMEKFEFDNIPNELVDQGEDLTEEEIAAAGTEGGAGNTEEVGPQSIKDIRKESEKTVDTRVASETTTEAPTEAPVEQPADVQVQAPAQTQVVEPQAQAPAPAAPALAVAAQAPAASTEVAAPPLQATAPSGGFDTQFPAFVQ